MRFQLYDRLNLKGWLNIIRRLLALNIDSPRCLSRYSFAETNKVAADIADPAHVLTPWQAARIAFTAETDGVSLIPFRQSAAMAAQTFRVKDIEK